MKPLQQATAAQASAAAGQMPPALSAATLRVSLGAAEVLHGLDLTLPTGCWTAVVGPNGAGKTTLLRALAQLLPYQGQVQLLGRAAATWTRRERACLLAWLGQNENVTQDLLVRDVVMLGRLPHQSWLGLSSPQDHSAVEEAMRQTQCWQLRDRPLESLSGGERQRVLLARALAVQAALLIMDEPLASLDPPHQSDWLRWVRHHVQSGGTVVSALHEITVALQADQLIVLAAGRIVHQGSCAHSATHRALEQVFEQRIKIHSVAGRWLALPV